jgi:hypothetical protein
MTTYLVVALPVRLDGPADMDPASALEHAVVRLDGDSDPGVVECVTWSSFLAAVIAMTLRRYDESGVLR